MMTDGKVVVMNREKSRELDETITLENDTKVMPRRYHHPEGRQVHENGR